MSPLPIRALPAIPPSLRIALLVTGVVAYLATPTLGHFPGAFVAWPTHGLTIAVLLAAPRERRVAVAGWLALTLLLVLAPHALLSVAGFPRLVAAVALTIGQAALVTLLYERAAGPRAPLGSADAYAWLLGSVLIGSLPMTAVASALIRVSGSGGVVAYSGFAWWLAASTSGATLICIVLALLPGAPRTSSQRPIVGTEFALLVAAYFVALASAFLEIDLGIGEVPPALATLPFLAWAGLRFGIRGFAVIASLFVVAVIAGIWLGAGPFIASRETALERFRLAWIYVAAFVGPGMAFPVALAEREEAARRTRAALAQLRAVFEGAPDEVAAIDRDLVLVAANGRWLERARQLLGPDFAVGDSLGAALHRLPAFEEDAVALWRRALAGERIRVTRAIPLGDPPIEVEVAFAPVRDERGEVVGASQVVRDLTQQARIQAQESEQRRLESIGRLAGGIAHDFNNILTAVLGYASLLRDSFAPDDPRRDDVAEIERGGARASALTQHLLAFARRREIQPRLVDAGALVEGLRRLLAPLLGPGVSLVIRRDPALRPVRVDPTQFEQVVVNLAVNARDAMRGTGTLTLACENAVHEGQEVVRLTVTDTGSGMRPDVQARAFEPFFTTKGVGEGTGLGLSTVHGIVHQAGGSIALDSAPGEGTTFRIHFPAVLAPERPGDA